MPEGPGRSSAGCFQPRLLLSDVDQPGSEYRLSLGVSVNLPGQHAELVHFEPEMVEAFARQVVVDGPVGGFCSCRIRLPQSVTDASRGSVFEDPPSLTLRRFRSTCSGNNRGISWVVAVASASAHTLGNPCLGEGPHRCSAAELYFLVAQGACLAGMRGESAMSRVGSWSTAPIWRSSLNPRLATGRRLCLVARDGRAHLQTAGHLPGDAGHGSRARSSMGQSSGLITRSR